MSELTEERDAVLAAIRAQVPEPPPTKEDRLGELQDQLRRIAPEVRAGDEAALAELARIEALIEAEKRRVEIDALADAEEADRARVAAEQEAERQRAKWAREKAEAESERDAQLVKVEKALAVLVEAIGPALELEQRAGILGQRVDPDYHHPRLLRALELRISRRLWDAGLRDVVDYPLGGRGREPLVTVTQDCAVCRHEQRDEIDAARAAGESLATVADRFGVSKSTLHRHEGHACCAREPQ